MPLWRSGPNTRTLPAILLTLPLSKAADVAHLCVPQNQVLGVCRGLVPDIQVRSTHEREDLVNATITSNVEGEEEDDQYNRCQCSTEVSYNYFPFHIFRSLLSLNVPSEARCVVIWRCSEYYKGYSFCLSFAFYLIKQDLTVRQER